MTLQGYLTSPIGILNIVSVLINAAAILCVSIRWTDDGNVLMQLIFQDRGWQTAVLIFLVASITVTASLLLIRTCASRAKIESMKKITIISLLIGTVFLCAFASAIEIWYVVRADSKDKDTKNGLERVVVCMILSLILFIVNFLLTMLLLCNFDHYTKMEQQTPVVAPAHPSVDPRDQRSSHHPPPPAHPPIIVPLPRHDPPMTIEAPPPLAITKDPQGSPVVTLPPSPPPQQRRRRSNSESD